MSKSRKSVQGNKWEKEEQEEEGKEEDEEGGGYYGIKKRER